MLSRFDSTCRMVPGKRSGPGKHIAGIVLRDQAANGNAGEVVQQREKPHPRHGRRHSRNRRRCPLGQGLGELRRKIRCAVVQRRVEAEFIPHEGAFLRTAGDADGAGTLDLGDLADRRSHRTAGRRNDHGLARFRLADGEQSDMGGEAGHSQHAKGGGDRRRLRIEFSATPPASPRHGSAIRNRRARSRRFCSPDVATPTRSRRCRLPSPGRSPSAWHRISHRSSARAYRDRARDTGCAGELRRSAAAGSALPPGESPKAWASRSAALPIRYDGSWTQFPVQISPSQRGSLGLIARLALSV